MAASLSGPNIEEEYMWAVTLDKDNKEYLWQPTDPADASSEEDEDDEGFDPSCKPNHRLLIKTALLSPDAPKDEVTVLEVETIGYKKEKVVTPFLALRSGVDLQRYVDLLLPDSATIKIKSGSGPITLVGSHCVDFYDYRNYGGDEEEDDEEESDDEDMEQEVEAAAVKKEEAVKEEEVEEGKKKKKSPQKEDKSPAKGEDKAGDAKKKSPAKEAKEPSPKKEATPGKEGKKEATPGKEGKKEATPGKEGKKRKENSDSGIEEDKKNKTLSAAPSTNAPFRRVKAEEIEVKAKFADNRHQAGFDEWGAKASQDLIVTRGKSFRHEKTKKKRGSYRGGPINVGVNSIKFDSD